MSAAEKLRTLGEKALAPWYYEGDDYREEDFLPLLPQIVAVVEAAERQGSGVSVIRALGFVGNAHYCPDCMNHFHDSCGQHKPGCSVLAGMLEDEEWPDLAPLSALSALDEALTLQDPYGPIGHPTC